MNLYLLQDLHEKLGRPRFFWLAVGLVLLALWMVGGNDQ